MSDYAELKAKLKTQLAELVKRAEIIEDDLRHPLDADWEEQAIDLADDESLAGVDEVLRDEILQTQMALVRIENGTYGTCSKCGGEIGLKRLEAMPTATRCINCA